MNNSFFNEYLIAQSELVRHYHFFHQKILKDEKGFVCLNRDMAINLDCAIAAFHDQAEKLKNHYESLKKAYDLSSINQVATEKVAIKLGQVEYLRKQVKNKKIHFSEFENALKEYVHLDLKKI